ncbi:MAG: efflux RND transporter periplasmic adaptor subunit [Rugosibacter sp.]|nr:efflux RND transporter periplasmic adaptor subunit [Rugosibacter sp.]
MKNLPPKLPSLTCSLVLATTLALSACHQAPPPPPVKIKSVRVMTVGAGATMASRAYPGEVRARFETLLGFRVPGKVVSRLVDAGAVVKRGQPLARIDAADFALQVEQSEAQSQLAAAELKRYRDLRSKNFVSQAALDMREAAATSARAQARMTRNQAAYTTLTADRDGVIAAVLAEAGQVVAAGQPIFRLAPDGEREVAISLPEGDISRLNVGAPAEVNLWAQGDQAPALTGKLREISAAADPVTRTYAARVTLPAAPMRLPVGLSATVRFTSPTTIGTTFVVPLKAIFQTAKQMAVWKVGAGDTVALAPVSVSRYEGDQAIVTQGLSAGDRIVSAGVTLRTAGEKVHAVEAQQWAQQ